MTIMRHLTAGLVAAFAVAALSASAFAAPPGTPPGQEKKAEQADPAAAAPQAAPAADPGPASAPGQLKKADQPAPAASAPPGQERKAAKAAAKTNGINATTAGVKPSSTTAKHTTCWTGGSMPSPTCTRSPHGTNPPDSSKRYGNGTTAAQIATSRGAPANTEIRGPGNSQPHKVCGKNGNWVDVHAVKSYANVCAETASGPSNRPSGVPVLPSASAAAGPASVGAVAGAVAGAAVATTTTAAAPTGGAAGAQAEAGGVAGALDVLGQAAGGSLPFTGLSLWAVALVGLAAVALGWTLRRSLRQLA